VFELVPAGLLAVATGRWLLVAFVGVIVLPAVRNTWVNMLRNGLGLWASAVAIVLATSGGLPAVAGVWAGACTVGIIRRSRGGVTA
jgi:hypothetical protein